MVLFISVSQVFIVIADVEPNQPKESPIKEDIEASGGSPFVMTHSGELLSIPATKTGGGGTISRQRICKSVSDAADRNRPSFTPARRSVKKSTSDTCIKQTTTKDTKISSTDLSGELDNMEGNLDNSKKHQQEKSIRKKILNR